MEAEIAELREQRDLLTLTKQQDEAERREAVKARTNVELRIKDLEDVSEQNAGLRQDLLINIEELEGEVAKKEAELAGVQPRYEQAQQKEADAQKLLEQAEAKQKSLFDKQARAGQYRTQKERDAYLSQAIRDGKTFIEKSEKNLEDIERNVGNVKAMIGKNEVRQQQVKDSHEQGKNKVAEQQKQLDGVNSRLAELSEKRKQIWKEDEKLNQTIAHAKEEQGRSQKILHGTMDRVSTLHLTSRSERLAC